VILDASGNAVNMKSEQDPCPRCGAEGEHELIKGFGGWQTVVCKCGEVLASGRERPEGA
jgi:uncharacterized Zn finger protein